MPRYRDGESMKDLLMELLDEYPALRKDEKKLVWCAWVKLGYADEYSMSYKDYLEAPLESTILRQKRRLFRDCPQYKFSEEKYAPTRRFNRQ